MGKKGRIAGEGWVKHRDAVWMAPTVGVSKVIHDCRQRRRLAGPVTTLLGKIRVLEGLPGGVREQIINSRV